MNLVVDITLRGVLIELNGKCTFIPWLFFVPFSGIGMISYSTTKDVNVPYSRSDKLTGLDLVDMIPEWVKFRYPSEHLIVLTEVNVQAKNIQFWAKVPKAESQFFLKDLVILFCKDKSEVIRLVENIPRNFADAKGFSAGELLIDNED